MEERMKKNIIFFDTETNGFKGSSVLSISAIKVEIDTEDLKNNFRKKDEFVRFYFREPDEEINKEAIKVNGLTDEIIADERKKSKQKYPLTFKEDMESFQEFCRDTEHFVAHNIQYDRDFIDFSLKYQFDTMMSNIDIVKAGPNKRGNGYKWPRLSECAKFYNIPLKENELHGSYYDVLITCRIFYKMLDNEDIKHKVENFVIKGEQKEKELEKNELKF